MTERPDWGPDVLGGGYEAATLALAADDEGDVVATLVRRRCDPPARRSVLYVHGYVDYFFQTHLADHFVARGWDFYALDMRKYGRSLRAHQTAYFTTSMEVYQEEIDAAVELLREVDGHDQVLAMGHSTGCLVWALWAQRRRGRDLVDGLVFNSPFLELYAPRAVRASVGRALGPWAKRRPKAAIRLPLTPHYGHSLHRDFKGDWDFDLDWKPVQPTPVLVGWLHAAMVGHRRIGRGLDIDVPILALSSDASLQTREWDERVHTHDVVLDADRIAFLAPRLGRHVTVVRVPGGKHDLLLSGEDARGVVFAEL